MVLAMIISCIKKRSTINYILYELRYFNTYDNVGLTEWSDPKLKFRDASDDTFLSQGLLCKISIHTVI
jgi:hypothetical protein